MATPDTRSSLVTVKHFTYRGNTQRWTNRYHFTGPETLTEAQFETLANAVVASEVGNYSAVVTVVEAIWYDASTATTTNPHGLATFTKVLAVSGSLDATGGARCPGDCAVVTTFKTDARSSKNHPIYLFKYWHDVFRDTTGTIDTVLAAQVTACNEHGDDLIEGFSDGTNTRVLCGPRGAVAQSRTTLPQIRHRDFPG